MSDNDENRIVVSQYTISNIERFFEHFQINMPDCLKRSIDRYKANPEDFPQEEVEKLRDAVCVGWMEAVQVQHHELLSDEVFTNLTAKINEKYQEVKLAEMMEQSMKEHAEE